MRGCAWARGAFPVLHRPGYFWMREVWGAPLVRRGEAVGAVFEEVGGEGVAEGVAGGALGDALTAYRLLHRALQHGFVQVVAAALAGLAVQVRTGGGEDPLPDPLATGVGVFAAEGSIVTRSLAPLPARTAIWLRSKSTSFTRSCAASRSRRPAP